MQRRHALYLAFAATLVALPASSQQNKNPPTNLYIDVLTHNVAGLPDMAGMMGGWAFSCRPARPVPTPASRRIRLRAPAA